MNVELEIQLIEALDALEHGEPVDVVLARYPESAADLRPMLATAAALPTLRMQPSEAQKMKSRQAFLKQGEALRQATRRRPALGLVPRLATMFAAFSVAFAVLGGGAVAASGSALPGDPLYSLKRTVENARLTFTADAAARAALQAQFDRQRRIETNALLDAGREIEVRFSGPIESIQPDAWVIGGLAVRIDANTQISGQPQIDRLADVRGLTGRTGLRALSIILDQTAEPIPVAPTSTPEPTETPAPTATPNPIVTPEPTEPRPTREPPPTTTPIPTVKPVQPVSIEFTGSVNSQAAATWVIDGTAIEVDSHTVIAGNIGVGQRVKVQALRYANGRLLATRIELSNDGGGGGDSGDTNSNDNQNNNKNDNHNSNDNQNRNDNHNENDNQNSNDNQNENDNHNSNDNQNSNENNNRNSNDR